MSRSAGLRWRATAACRVRSLSPVGVIVKRPGSPASPAMRQQSQRHVRRAACAVALAGLVTLAACSKKEAAAPAPRPVVAVALHADGSAMPAASLPGEVQARYSTPLSFRVDGKIIERRVRLGDLVKSGQIVAQLDPADAQKNAASAQAQLDAAQHGLVFAKQQLDRDQAQAKENLIAPAQLEQTTNAYASALAQRDQAAQQAALAKNQLQYTTLARRSRGRHHGGTGRHRSERVRGPGRLQPRLERRHRRAVRRAGKRARRVRGRTKRQRHARRAAGAQVHRARARTVARRRLAKPHLSRAAHARQPRPRRAPRHDRRCRAARAVAVARRGEPARFVHAARHRAVPRRPAAGRVGRARRGQRAGTAPRHGHALQRAHHRDQRRAEGRRTRRVARRAYGERRAKKSA